MEIVLIILLTTLLTALWSILLVDYFDPYKQLLKLLCLSYVETDEGPMKRLNSFNPIIDFGLFCITKLFNCPLCLSSWITAIVILVMLHSWWGFLLMPVSYFTTMFLKKIISYYE